MNTKKKEIDVNIKIRAGGVTKTATPTKVTKSAVVTPDITITVPNTGAVPTVKADTPW